MKKRIVIAGAGFGGVHAYLTLHKKLCDADNIEIVLINLTDYFTFIPMIHEVATGNLLPSSIVLPLRTLPHCDSTKFIEGRVSNVNCDKQELTVTYEDLPTTGVDNQKNAKKEETMHYDYLVMALGSETNFFAVPGADKYAHQLKTLEDAVAIRNHIIEQFQAAARLTDEKKQKDALRFIVVGDGPTGVELAGELADLIEEEMMDAFPELTGKAEVRIIGRGTRLMEGPLDPWFSHSAERAFTHKPTIKILHETSVTAVTEHGVETTGGPVSGGMVFWTAGVKARELMVTANPNIHMDERSKRIKVNQYLQIPERKNVFVVGDQALAEDTNTGHPYPMRAQFALRQGTTAGRNIHHLLTKQPLIPFTFKEKGLIISIGKGGSFAKVAGLRLSGVFGSLVYHGVYVMMLVGARARLRTFVEWGLNIFSARDIRKL